MTPSHLLRATLPIRAIAPMAARSTMPLSIPSLRFASTSSQTLSKQKSTSPASGHLQPPTLLRSYAYALKTGTVTSVGRMERTVTVTYRHSTWDKRIRKYYPVETRYLVSDPRDSLREGDVIEFSSGAPKSRHVHHIVERIITPFAVPIEERPAVMSRAELEKEREARWAAKYIRRESRRLGQEVDLVAPAAKLVGKTAASKFSSAELIHLVHKGNERVGRVKRLVLERTARQPEE
ncbi:Nucleic acid-binding OB-fold [Penicillium taxi]|uniref:Nucleic acid-binding OB-fold n=1 Tax=Penicillium taxi TaxID=168475 RepID=UPI0025457C19|nr:Nucleic acid-binding OB-fold [Penicillium taxi]KAJ5898800.1 Nucleic acid-binding OB-fold [Penicillium taxi]